MNKNNINYLARCAMLKTQEDKRIYLPIVVGLFFNKWFNEFLRKK